MNNRDLINQVIETAKNKFITGIETNNAVLDGIKTGSISYTQFYRPERVKNGWERFPQYSDSPDAIWNANKIPGTSFEAAEGPIDKGEVADFILSSPKHIIALGAELGGPHCSYKYPEFYAYMAPNLEKIDFKDKAKKNIVNIKSNITTGEIQCEFAFNA